MTEKLSWEEIRQRYDQEWIELVEYDWPEQLANPRSGIVRTHGADKKQFHLQCRRDPVPSDSAIIFVGKPPIPPRVVLSPSLIRIIACDK